MNGSARGGNGRGNNRRHSFRRRDADSRPEDSFRNERFPARESGASSRSDTVQRNEIFPKSDASPRNSSGGRGSENAGRQHRGGDFKRSVEDPRKGRPAYIERPKWNPPKINTDPLPVPDCPWCGKPIRDISTAMTDKNTGVPVHFDCVAAKIAGGENLERGDTIAYIGGGRFGIVAFGNQAGYSRQGQRAGPDSGRKAQGNSAQQDRPRTGGRASPDEGREFKIKKIIEWENKDDRAGWRSVICDHYSVT